MFEVETSALGERFAADPGRDAACAPLNGEPGPPFTGGPVP